MRLACFFGVRSHQGFGSSVIERTLVNINSKLTFLRCCIGISSPISIVGLEHVGQLVSKCLRMAYSFTV